MLSTIQIFASGSEGGEQMELQLDGAAVQSWSVAEGANSGSFQTYTYNSSNVVVADDVRIAFTNDAYDPSNGIDANLRIDAIEIDNVRYETESIAVFSTGSWLPADGTQPGFRQSEFLNTNGYFQFANVGASSTISVRARGDEGGEQFRLIVDGSIAATYTTSTSFQDFSYTTTNGVSMSDIRIEFFGSVYNPAQGIDTNLVVDHVSINGVQVQTESSSTFSTGTWLPADGIQPGFRESEVLHANGYFDFSAFVGSHTIELVARGDEGTENMRVLAGGVLLGEFVMSSGYQKYTVATDDYVAGFDVRIEFTNDEYDPSNGVDSNLYVDKVTLNGLVREVEDPSTFGFGTWNNGYSEGFNQSEVLNANGYFLLDFNNQPVPISFTEVGAFVGVAGGSNIITNPTSLQFGPDGRFYVSEQNGMINAFTIQQVGEEYVATAVEQISAVKDIQNHNDNGSLNGNQNRQITGIAVVGTSDAPVLYVSSSDPRISSNGEVNLDTNSGVITRLTRVGNGWDAVDIIRGLPRSEENHANNGLVLSPNGTELYVAVGGNTNNGAPSQFFSYTGEYALSGTVLEIDLNDINARPILTDNAPGQSGRRYIYDLPTLDDPSIPNVTDGVGENAQGLDEAGPWGGNDGFNMAILPSDAPLRIFADGFRNHYDLVITQLGKLYTVDNGSNANLGGNPIVVNGQVTNQPNNGGSGDPEPLFLIEDGGYYGHPNPARSNQDLAWTVYNDSGNPDNSLSPNSVSSLAALVPDSVNIQNGFIIDPSKFTGDPARLQQSGIRVERDSVQSNSLINVGSSSNGLVEYNSTAFNGQLNGDLLVAQFNGNIGRLDLNADGTTATFATIPGLTGLSTPLDVTTGPDGTVWVGELGGDFIKVFAPSENVQGPNTDVDGDGLLNTIDPFTRDQNNGGEAVVTPGNTLVWDFDANQDNNLVGPDGYGGGLTGVMVNGVTDFEQFFQAPSSRPGQDINLDNVKFITAAGGGTTVVEFVSSGDAFQGNNSGEFLFHTGVTVAPSVDTLTIEWTIFNPTSSLAETFQQLGGYIGTGDQSNYLKFVAIQHPQGEIQLVLEDGDAVANITFIQANDLFQALANSRIYMQLTIDVNAGTATPVVTYETSGGNQVVSGATINLAGTAVLDAIQGNYSVSGVTTGLAVGLFSSNFGPAPQPDFQAIFDGIEISGSTTSAARGLAAASPTLYAPLTADRRDSAPSAAVLEPDGRLVVQGTENRDNVAIRMRGDQLHVQSRLNQGTPERTKESLYFDASAVQRIVINLGDGQDVAKLASNVRIDATIHGGGDDDRLLGGNGRNTLWGGDGNDFLRGGNDADVIIGEDGDDRLLGRGGSDLLSGMNGRDQLVAGRGSDANLLVGGEAADRLVDGSTSDLLVHQTLNDESTALFVNVTVWLENHSILSTTVGTVWEDSTLETYMDLVGLR